MRILAVSYAFPPWLAPRSVQVQRVLNALVAEGHDATLVQRDPATLDVTKDPELASRTATSIKTIPVAPHRYGRRVERLQKRLSRLPDDANFWAVKAFSVITKIADEYDLIVTFSTPVSDHLVGLLCKMRKRLPWVAFFSDPFTKNPYLRFSTSEFVINRWLERSILKRADAVIFVNEHTLQSAISGGAERWAAKCHVIPHAFDESLYGEANRSQESLIMRHLGDFYGKRTPEALLKAVAVAMNRMPSLGKRLRIELYGAPDGMQEWLGQAKLGDVVQYRGQVGYLESLRLMKDSDVLLVVDAPGEKNLFLTSKLIDYVGARRPILALTPLVGPTADLLSEINGDLHDSSDTEGIADCIIKYVRQRETGALNFDVPPQVYERYSVGTVAAAYADLFDKVAQSRNSGGGAYLSSAS